ncbi:hypothetical protein BgiMline_025301, partial [Biomphalaria glabrata]
GLNGLLNMRSRKKDEHFKAAGGTLNISLTVKRFYRSTNDQHVYLKFICHFFKWSHSQNK